MDPHIYVAIVGALINIVLSVGVGYLINKTQQPFLIQVKQVFDTNRQVILTSSLILAITIYLALKITPEIQFSLNELITSDNDSNYSDEFASILTKPITPIVIGRVTRTTGSTISPELQNLFAMLRSNNN
jgi:phosphotransferase system  glucose/maltose/N-acetylglucosamine-specific IIC component